MNAASFLLFGSAGHFVLGELSESIEMRVPSRRLSVIKEALTVVASLGAALLFVLAFIVSPQSYTQQS